MKSNAAIDDIAKAAPAKVSLQAQKQAFVRDAIWAAAIDLFAEKGFEETTVDDIVNAAGTSRRTFFRHFESKRDLMAQPVLSYGASLRSAIGSCRPDCSPAELFRHVVLEVALRTVSDSRMRKVMEVAGKYPAAREAQLSRVAELHDQVAEAFAQRCNDEIAVQVLAGLTLSVLSIAYRIWFSKGNKDITAAVQHALGQLSVIVCGEEAEPRNKRITSAPIPRSTNRRS
jgi:AcrR family transcriptional regulator